MRYRSRLALFGLGCMALLWATLALATPPGVFLPFALDLRIVSYDQSTGRVVLDVGIATHVPCPDGLSARVDSLDGLAYFGPDSWQLAMEPGGETLFTRVEFTIPTHDTSGFELITSCGEHVYDWSRYFVTAGDSIAIVCGDPRTWPDPDPAPDSVVRRLVWEETERQLAEQRRTSPPPPPQGYSSTYIIIYPGDSALADSLTDDGKRRLAIMRSREREPLVDSDMDTWEIEGRVFQRAKGERQFHRIKGHTTEEWCELAVRMWDSLDAADADKPLEIFVDLRKPEQEAFMRSFVDSLIPTDSAGIYRTVILYRQQKDLEAHGIRYRNASAGMWRQRSRQPVGNPSPESREQEAPGKSADSGRSSMFYEDFEWGSFSNTWIAMDTLPQNGLDYWGSI